MAAVIALALLALFSSVHGKVGYGPGEQEYGHVQVRTNANMFYWLFYVQDEQVSDFTERPLVIWLQGGPGASSAGFGNFGELGPLHVNGSAREASWAKHVNLMFIDNPVGTGFSYVTSSSAYTTTNEEIGADLVQFTRQFYSTFPEFSKTPLYVFCESYGGKMVAEYAKQLDAAIKSENLNIDFRGIALGDSWIDPGRTVYSWSTYLYNTGLVDEKGRAEVDQGYKRIDDALRHEEYALATDLWGELEGTIDTLTSGVDFYNILYKVSLRRGRNNKMMKQPKEVLYNNHVTRDEDADIEALMEGPVREALGIPSSVSFGGQSGNVFDALYEDFMLDVIDTVSYVLDNTQIEVYVFSGQLDLIVATPGTVQWLDYMPWRGKDDWKKKAARKPFVVNGFVEGYVKELENLHFYWINRAGHMVPTDNPAAAIELLRTVTRYDK